MQAISPFQCWEQKLFSFLRLTESILIGRLLEIGGITQATKVWKLQWSCKFFVESTHYIALSNYNVNWFHEFFFEWEQYFVISKLWFFYNVCTYFPICITTLTFLRPKNLWNLVIHSLKPSKLLCHISCLLCKLHVTPKTN